MNPRINASHQEQQQKLSRAGYLFNSNETTWRLTKDVTLYFCKVLELLDPNIRNGFLRTMVYYAENLSASHASNILDRFRHMLKTTNAGSISTTSLINYRSTLSTQTQWYLGAIRGFLRKWNDLGYPGVSDEIIELINGWTLKGSVKGDVIKRLDPLHGPLTDLELQGFNECTVQAFEQNKISLAELALGLCQSNTGRRPVQISHLKIKDVLQGKNKNGDPVYFLNVPRAKQRGATFRGEFKQFAITQDLWVILNSHAKNTVTRVLKILGYELDQKEQSNIPLFPCYSSLEEVTSLEVVKELLNSDRLHIKTSVISETVQLIAQVTKLHSERTGELINLSANRFRYTIGTRAAREGFGEMVIAELLDHSDTQNAGVYIQNIPEHVEKLDQAVGRYLAPYAQAFAGMLVDSERDAIRGNDLNSRIRTGTAAIGTCGNHGFCGANAPIPCYTCIHFQPWLDGPHQIIYEGLIADRERIRQMTGDPQIAGINDRTIVAVADVIQRCEKRKQELSNGRNNSFQIQNRIESCGELEHVC